MLFGCAMRKSVRFQPRPRIASGIERLGSGPGETTLCNGSIRRRSGIVLIAVVTGLRIPAFAESLSSNSCSRCIWTRIAAAIAASDSTPDVGRLDHLRPGQREALQAATEVIQGKQ
jgi:hypothetical protein